MDLDTHPHGAFAVFQEQEQFARALDALQSVLIAPKPLPQLNTALLKARKTLSVKGGTHVSEIIEFVDQIYSDPTLSLAVISRHLHLSERHLRRLFFDQTGQTFRAYLRQIRIKRSLILFSNHTLDVKSIAAKVGYRSQSHFCLDFRYIMDCTPTEFKARPLW